MAGVMNLLEAAARFAATEAAVREAEHAALEAAAELVKNRAKGYIGHPHDWWAPLTDETLKSKDGVNSPLLETGQLRDSIESTVEFPSAYVGSNDERALWHELGTSHVPPRSFLAHSAQESGPEIEKMVAKVVGGAIAASIGGSRILEAIEIAKFLAEAFEPVVDAAKDLATPETEEERERRR
jgi:phage gpG-like protein